MFETDDPGSPLFDRASYILLSILLIVIFFTFRQYGISWDEPAQREIGMLSLKYYISGFKDLRVVAPDYFNRIYGGFFDMIAELATLLSPSHPYEIRHLVTALAGFVGIIGCWKLARHLGGRMAGFLAILLMLFFPTYIGHMFNNPKDIPFAASYIWSTYFLILALSKSGKPSPGLFLKLAVATGITAGIRVGGLVIFGVAAVGFTVYLLLHLTHKYRGAMRDILQTALFLVTAFIAAFGIMLVFWPWAQRKPISNTLYSLRFISSWEGRIGDQWYIFKCLSVKLPEVILFGLLCAFLLTLWNARHALGSIRSEDQKHRSRFVGFTLLTASFVVPAAYIVLKKSLLYNEMRQVIFIALPMVICSAIAISSVIRKVWETGWMRARYTALILVACLLSHPAYSIARLYPYHYIYCNIISGGTRGLGKAYTYEYYLHSYRELGLQLRCFLSQQNAQAPPQSRFKVFVHGSPQCMAYYLPLNCETVDDASKADFGAYCPQQYKDTRKSREIGEVSRCGVKLSTLRIYGRD
jgi:hypothetical protein